MQDLLNIQGFNDIVQISTGKSESYKATKDGKEFVISFFDGKIVAVRDAIVKESHPLQEEPVQLEKVKKTRKA